MMNLQLILWHTLSHSCESLVVVTEVCCCLVSLNSIGAVNDFIGDNRLSSACKVCRFAFLCCVSLLMYRYALVLLFRLKRIDFASTVDVCPQLKWYASSLVAGARSLQYRNWQKLELTLLVRMWWAIYLRLRLRRTRIHSISSVHAQFSVTPYTSAHTYTTRTYTGSHMPCTWPHGIAHLFTRAIHMTTCDCALQQISFQLDFVVQLAR